MTRAGLHAYIDQISDAELEPTAALLEAARTHDRALIQALLAEEEPLEPGDAQALGEVDRNNTIAGEEVERRYGRTSRGASVTHGARLTISTNSRISIVSRSSQRFVGRESPELGRRRAKPSQPAVNRLTQSGSAADGFLMY